ncbi:hypothetical protein [Effusibacillus consociatus]|uniref:Uncharacterized protein n=1 Tax=Effusibacillus consociatus TaxID=1117041 RepID=A0ABV9Q1S5_9BACL
MGRLGLLILSSALGFVAGEYLSLSVIISGMAFIAGIFMTHSA